MYTYIYDFLQSGSETREQGRPTHSCIHTYTRTHTDTCTHIYIRTQSWSETGAHTHIEYTHIYIDYTHNFIEYTRVYVRIESWRETGEQGDTHPHTYTHTHAYTRIHINTFTHIYVRTQSWSETGEQGGFADPRGVLFWGVSKCVVLCMLQCVAVRCSVL